MPLTQAERFKKEQHELLQAAQQEYDNIQEYQNQLDELNTNLLEVTPGALSFYIPPTEEDSELLPGLESQFGKKEDSFSVNKKRKEMRKQYAKALKTKVTAKLQMAEPVSKVIRNVNFKNSDEIFEKKKSAFADFDDSVLKQTLKSINEIEKSNLAMIDYDVARKKQNKEADGTGKDSAEAKILKFKLNAQNERVTAYKNRAKAMVPGTREREKMQEKVEEETLKADHLRREYKVACMRDGDEKQRDAATIKRHDKFDFFKKLFRKPTKLSKADAELEVKADATIGIQQDLKLVNEGRATMGGTKAMYTFVNEDTGEQWLFKEATNCIGMSKPESAVVTEAASKLQRKVRGELSIPAKCVKDEQGKVIGSIQQKMDTYQNGVDLFKWQANPDNTLPPETKADLLKEHILDWTLCNFDTKGENFLTQHGNHIISFDKEASFNHLLDKEAQTMSYSYKPHSNNTIYNTMFKGFIEGKVELDFYAAEEAIEKIEAISDQEFLDMFKETLDVKYGTKGSSRSEAEEALLKRKNNLREDCRRFYTELINERIKAIDADENLEERDKRREKIELYTLLVHRKKDEPNYDDTKPPEFTFRNESREIVHVSEDVYLNANEDALYARAEWIMRHPINTDPNVISNPSNPFDPF